MTQGSSPNAGGPKRIIGRYALYDEIAAGGMATVHYGRLLGPVGFSRTVAIKRLHPQFSKDPEFVSMFLDEARLAARIRHPNVVQTLDVVATQGELFLVMDFIQGESLSKLIRVSREHGQRLPPRIVTTIMTGALSGLHAAHEARNERGEPLEIVHRDISPQNILVGQDGVARVLDFGVAKAAGRIQTTREGQLKGKLAYMAPEQLHGHSSRQIDVFASAIVLWEALTTRRLFAGENEGAILGKLMSAPIDPPSTYAPEARAFDAVVMRGLERDPARRWATAREFSSALERCVGLASPTEVSEFVEHMAKASLHERALKIAEIESSSATLSAVPTAAQIASGDLGATMGPGPALARAAAAPAAAPPAPAFVPQPPTAVEPSSQLSSISVSRNGPPPSGSNKGLVLLLGAVAALAVAGAVGVAVFYRGKAPASPSAAVADRPQLTAPSTLASATIAPSALQPAASASPAPSAQPPITVATTAPVVTATAAPGAGTSPHGGGHGHHPEASAAAPASATPPTSKPNCDPAYTLDAAGHKKWKPECLGN